MARVVAFVLAVTVGSSGVLPFAASACCAPMKRLMAHPCCVSRSVEVAIGRRCCDKVGGGRAEIRATQGVGELRIFPAPLVATLAAAAATPELMRWRRQPAVQARGSPPGDRLHRLSSVLRV